MARHIEQLVNEQMRKSELAKHSQQFVEKPCISNVVTISRRMGSGARIIAQKLADDLGWSLWDKELVNSMAQNARVSQKVVNAFDEHTISEIELFARGLFGDEQMAGFIYARHLAKAVKSIARLGNAIILGRGANLILPDALKIRIDESDDLRIQNMIQFEGLTAEQSRRKLRESDRSRRQFLISLFGRERADAAIFDLSLWMDNFTNDDAVEIIKAAIKAYCKREVAP
ncbi:MAG: cytidylate kinase-like family protein [Armatimonadetes bacterium]|nr:cytidylate kinase-like family protein [Armatimonadota bacterium]